MDKLQTFVGNSMKSNIITNDSKYTKYYNIEKGYIYEMPEEFLTVDLIRSSSLNAHVINSRHFSPTPCNYSPVLNNIIPIPPRSRWIQNGLHFEPILSNPRRIKNVNLQSIIKASTRALSKICKEEIAVELSGGLDTSIIISIIKKPT